MPYTVDNPPAWLKNLPKGAIRIGVETFNAVLRDTKNEDQARKAAWARVKTKYKKEGDTWVLKAAGEGQGVGGPRQGIGGTDTCVCPECGSTAEHDRDTPCSETKCPECGAAMTGAHAAKSKTEGADGQLQGSAGLGICICPTCGAQAEHEQGFECKRLNCPTCGALMAEPAPEARAMVELVITKASLQPDGTMRWQAVASDTLADQVGDQATLALFNDWIERVEKSVTLGWLPPPRRPFLGVSHYPNLSGFGEAGVVERMYVDGNRFKADGPFLGGSVGRALFQAIHDEREIIQRGAVVEEPIRISAAWWDIQHAHGSFVFVRQSLLDRCPMCGPGSEKTFLKGQLDHLASTRVPINPRTALGLEEKAMTRKTRRDDAASIVGEEMADELEERASELVGKSETEVEESPALVIRAEDESEEPDTIKAATKTVDGEKFPASDFLVVEDSKKPSTWHLQVKRHGKPDHGLMGQAWAALHKGFRGNKYEGPGRAQAIKDLKTLYKKEKVELPTEKANVVTVDEGSYRPYGGATSLDEAEAYIHALQIEDQIWSNWDVFNSVIGNILSSQDEDLDKLEAVRQAVGDFSSRVSAIKASIVDAYLVQPATIKGGITMPEQQVQQENDPALRLKAAVDAALARPEVGREGIAQAVQAAIEAYVKEVKARIDAVAPPAPGEEVAAAVSKALQPLVEQMGLVLARLGQASGAQLAPAASVPQQKSFAGAPAGAGDSLPVSPVTNQPSRLTAMIRRSTGIVQ